MQRGSGKQDIQRLIAGGFQAMQKGDLKNAERICQQLLSIDRNIPQAHFLVGLVAMQMDNKKLAAQAFHTVTKLDATSAGAWAHLAKIMADLGYMDKALEHLQKAEQHPDNNPVSESVIAATWTLLENHRKAKGWYEKAYEKHPKAAALAIPLANAHSYLGDIDAAEDVLKTLLEHSPEHPQAHWILAGLKKAEGSEQADQMVRIADNGGGRDDHGRAFLLYGAGKLYEDLELWDQAWQAFDRAAKLRRGGITYDEAGEIAWFDAFHRHYSKDWFDASDSDVDNAAPILIIGQPRTGTTLVERIITSHSDVISAGELQQLYLSIRRLSNVQTKTRVTADLVTAAKDIDPTVLGKTYLANTHHHREAAPHFVDKMPVNFLYAPLLSRGLPHAKFVHLTRGGMDSVFSSFKQLFADAYLHSYDQEEMARHYVRYHQLMDRWQDLMGERMQTVAYEDVVTDTQTRSRSLIDFLGLDWQDSVLDFHKSTAAVSTASAVQVRSKVHSKSVGRWQRYEEHLQPAFKILKAAGLA